MKQLLIANTIVSTGDKKIAGQLSVVNNAEDNFFEFILGHGPSVPTDNLVVYKNNLKTVKTNYSAGTYYNATFNCDINVGYNYNEVVVQISKRGAVFNERNRWTASGHGSSAADIATELVKNINEATGTHGLVATAEGASVTITNTQEYVDYDIKVTKESVGPKNTTSPYNEVTALNVTETHAVSPVGDADYVKELMLACIGDKGQGYTYLDAAPNGDMNANRNHFVGNISGNYNIYTIKCYNPRFDHNIDEHLVQTIHIAVPTSANASVLETALGLGQGVASASEPIQQDAE